MVRGCDWQSNYEDKDGGESHVGMVKEISII